MTAKKTTESEYQPATHVTSANLDKQIQQASKITKRAERATEKLEDAILRYKNLLTSSNQKRKQQMDFLSEGDATQKKRKERKRQTSLVILMSTRCF